MMIEQTKSVIGSISVIIPAYNSARFLPEAIESVLRQTYSVFEIIVVDDGSTDETREICEQYPTVTYIYQANQGQIGARNTGLQASKGEYLLFFDSDDCLLPNAVEAGVNCINTHPEVGFVFGNYIFQSINPDGSYTTQEIYDNQHEEANYANILAGKLKLQVASVLFRRIAVEAVGGFDPKAQDSEDYNLFLRVAREFPIKFHNEVILEYRYNGANISSNPVKMLIATLNSLSLQWNYIQQTGNKEYEVAYELGKKTWTKLFLERLPYEISRDVQAGKYLAALGILRLILTYDPKLKLIDQEIYEASKRSILSKLRLLPIEPSMAYWKQQLIGAPPLLPLPTDRPRGAEQTFRGDTQSFILAEKLTSALSLLSTDAGVTLSMTLLAAFNTLLYRYTGIEDIIVGSPLVNRDKSSEVFVNAVVLRTDMSENPSFQKLLNRVRKVVLAGEAHQDVPFEILVEELQLQPDSSYSPLFQVMFAFEEDISFQKIDLSSLTASPWVLENNEGKFDLTLLLEHNSNKLVGKWVYNTDLFNASTIARMNEHFQVLLENIVAHPERPISELRLMTEKERHQLLVEWNNTQSEYPQNKCIHHWFEEQVEHSPDGIALVYENHHLTYRELNNQANQLANYLIDLGVRANVLVGICVERSLEMIVGILGILKAGGAYVPLDPNNPQDRLEYILSDAQVRILVTQSTLLDILPVCEQIVCLDTDCQTIAQYPQSNPLGNVTSHDLAYIIYTSGSTGKPKGVLVSHSNVIRLFTATESWYNFHAGDVWTLFHSFAFDFSVWEIWGALFYGGRIVVVPYLVCRDTKAFYKLLVSERVTILNQTPSAFYQLIEVDKCSNLIADLSLRLVIFGGEALKLANLQPWFERHSDRFPQLINMYGITETTVHVTYRPINTADVQASGSLIGRPIPDLQIYLLDRYRQPVPIGVCGEMYVGGAGLAKGYWQRDLLTTERFISNPFSKDPNARLYKSGDLARYLNDGSLEYIGRIDDQVKIRGFRIELGEIESVLSQHPIVEQVLVIAQQNDRGDKHLISYIVHNPEKTPDHSELRRFLHDKLPYYMVPSFFVFLDTMPLTSNGKVDRKALPTPTIGGSKLATVYPKPQTKTEKVLDLNNAPSTSLDTNLSTAINATEEILIGIWEQVLGIQPIGITDDFFELGGHSLLAVSLFAQIEKTFGENLPLATLFKAPTIEQMASFLRQEKPTEELWDCLVPLQTDGSKTPLFCMHGGGFNVLIYRRLAQDLGADRPIYALQARGLDGSLGLPFDSLEDMATDYIQQIKTIQPQGPYLLSGLSNGGNVSLEMAQQLQSSGETVALLAMFDTYGPEKLKLLPPFPRFLSSLLYAVQYSVPRTIGKAQKSELNVLVTKLNNAINELFLSKDTSNVPAHNLERDSVENHEILYTSDSIQNLLVRSMNRISDYIIAHSPCEFITPSFQLRYSNDKVSSTLKKLEVLYNKIHQNYVPQPYQGKITIFRAMEAPPGYQIAPMFGWSKIAKEGVEIHQVPGHHTSIMESPVLAKKMRSCLKRAIKE